MNQSKISVRYAKALLSYAIDKNICDRIKEDMSLVFEICKENKDFIEMLENPVVKTSEKRRIILTTFNTSFHKVSMDLLNLILTNNREVYIEGIARNFLDQYREYKGIKNALFRSVVPLDKETASRIEKILEKKYKCNIIPEEKVEKDLIGGFILRVEDQQIDASLATQLSNIKKELKQSS
jgi:F-type H+-transporting ATPase subunit delta